MNKRTAYDEIDALNFSRAKALLRSPRHFQGAPPLDDAKTSLLLGTVVHAVLLQGMNPGSALAIKPQGMKFNTKEGQAWRASQTKPIVTYDEHGDIIGMVESLLDNQLSKDILSTCLLREQIFTGLIQGVACKCLIDALGSAEGKQAVVEIKTSLDCRAEFFSKRVVSDPFHYDLQSAWYRTLSKSEFSCWIVVENKQPWDCAVYFPGESMRRSGEAKMAKVLAIYKACKQLDRWPGAQPDPLILDVPHWYNVHNVLRLATDEQRLLTDSEEESRPAAQVSPAGA
jgi:PDDEXK-like domain of unknown function (DUF3799)